MKLIQSLRMRAKAAGWTNETLKAWVDSCAHWRRMATGKRRKGEGPSADSCAFCKMFLNEVSGCDGCPVKNTTGEDYCRGTPFDKAYTTFHCENAGPNSVLFRRAAHRELAFLESLLPKLRKGKR